MIKQVIVLRKDLNMRKGKMVAQGAHASIGAVIGDSYKRNECKSFLILDLDGPMKEWLGGTFTKICVSVDNEAELLEIYNRARNARLRNCLIQDNGLTEFNGVKTYTAVAIGPNEADEIDEITGNLPLL